MEGIRMRDDTLRHAMGGGDDEIIGLEVEHFYGQGKKREIGAVLFPEERHALEETRPDDAPLDVFALASLDVKEGIDRGFGEDLGQDLQDLFSPSLAGQPVMDKGDFHVFHRKSLYLKPKSRLNRRS
jgi:hypothetical protein